MTHGFDYILNLEDYFNTNSYMQAIEVKIDGEISKPREEFIKKFNDKFDISRSILISFESSVNESCIVMWRFKENERFFYIKIERKEIKDFVRNFIRNSIKIGHNGEF